MNYTDRYVFCEVYEWLIDLNENTVLVMNDRKQTPLHMSVIVQQCRSGTQDM